MAKKVSKEEYDKWAHKMYGVLQYDANVNYTRVINRCAMVDLESKKTVFYNSDNDGYGTMECMAKAYSELKGLEVPEVEGIEEIKEIPQPWRAEEGENYYFVDTLGSVYKFTDNRSFQDNRLFETGNYYKTEERAKEVACKIKLILKTEKLYDLYCPGFKPNFKDYKDNKYGVHFNHITNSYNICLYSTIEDINNTYFTKEAAEEICKY